MNFSYLLSACDKYAPDDRKCVCINNAIFVQDSAWATKGVGAKTNNPCNMRPAGENSPILAGVHVALGNGNFAKFSTLRDGVEACVELYARKYRGKSPSTIVAVWAQTTSPGYHGAVANCFTSIP